mgnify:CR=1 FL=1
MAADLKGRIALVTGVGPGLGQGIAVGLARAGASVVVCDVNDEAVAATRKDDPIVAAQSSPDGRRRCQSVVC